MIAPEILKGMGFEKVDHFDHEVWQKDDHGRVSVHYPGHGWPDNHFGLPWHLEQGVGEYLLIDGTMALEKFFELYFSVIESYLKSKARVTFE